MENFNLFLTLSEVQAAYKEETTNVCLLCNTTLEELKVKQ